MLLALLTDLSALPGCRVVTTWDARLPHPDIESIDWRLVTGGPPQERELFRQLAAAAEVTLVVAPETDGILHERSQIVCESRGKLAGCLPAAVSLCADKLAVHRLLRNNGIRTPLTAPLDAQTEPVADFPLVVKPRDGAGSLHTRLIQNRRDWEICRRDLAGRRLPAMIQQEFQPGVPCSRVVLAADGGQLDQVWPACRQRFSCDGRFTFLGGRIEPEVGPSPELSDDLQRIFRAVSGLRGYVGIDMICPTDGRSPCILDINPRLTTSYLGYRRLAVDNLGPWLIGRFQRRSVRWVSRSATFDNAGSGEPISACQGVFTDGRRHSPSAPERV